MPFLLVFLIVDIIEVLFCVKREIPSPL